MDEQAMLTRDLVLRLCETATEFDLGWLETDGKAVAPFTAPRDQRLIQAIVEAGHEAGADRLLVCRTRAEYSYEPVTEVAARGDALLELIRCWGREPTDFLVAVEDMSAAVLVTEARLTVAAGPPEFVRRLVGADVAQARADFAAEARASQDPQLIRAAHRYGCMEPVAKHARDERGPDLAERAVRRAETRRAEHPRGVGFYQALRGAWVWAALVLLIFAGLFVPEVSVLLPLSVAMLWLLAQLAWLARSRTVRFASLARMLVLGGLVAVPIALVEIAVAGIAGLDHRHQYAYAYIAVPVEEVGKLAPLLLLWLVARQRYRRFAAVDYLLLAAASGAGFHLVEQVSYVAYLSFFYGYEDFVVPSVALFTLFPGGIELLENGTRFSGHAVTTGLVGAALGLAAVGWRRYGGWLWLLPPAAFGWAALEHMNINASLAQLEVTPLTASMFALLGGGHATRWLLLLLLVIAVVMDYRMIRTAEASAPRLPGRAPLASLIRRAHGRAVRIRVRIPGDYAPLFRWAALVWARMPLTLAETVVAIVHEASVQLAAARQGPRVLYRAWDYLPERRAYAMGAARAGGRSWRRFPDREQLTRAETDLAIRIGVGPKGTAAGGAAAAVLLTAALAVAPVGGPDAPQAEAAYAAVFLGGALDWYAALPGAAQGWVATALAALISVLSLGWGVPKALPSARTFLREPFSHAGVCLGAFAPGQLPYGAAALAGMALPGSVDRLLRPRRDG